MTGAYTNSAFAGVVIIVISKLRYTTCESSLAHEYEIFLGLIKDDIIFYGSEGLF